MQAKRRYKRIVRTEAVGKTEIYAGDNYEGSPIVPL